MIFVMPLHPSLGQFLI